MNNFLKTVTNIKIYFIISMLASLFVLTCKQSTKTVKKKYDNKALKFDGIDDKVDVFFKPIIDQWTLSVWIKGNDTIWNTKETIISNGWATIELWEQNPLYLKNGYPSVGNSIRSDHKLGSKWHHLAVVNDGVNFTLYVDGEIEAIGKGGKGICPSFIGSNDNEDYFKGSIDEVRIWNTAINQETIKEWMHQPLKKITKTILT